eukprot:NODE_3049_length_500_cov_35.767184_g2640_i0.p5 GENE.NODE_3049_length_500_cov_35.767184_g2640_i0~~NODE_3049_length_500_cov_35.767184_g2640_i0.p5  ORF type:complete len:56 (-),score=5.88 NODE_3049_length_500_cov_35.767184_g2640_i0:102-269(-)
MADNPGSCSLTGGHSRRPDPTVEALQDAATLPAGDGGMGRASPHQGHPDELLFAT